MAETFSHLFSNILRYLGVVWTFNPRVPLRRSLQTFCTVAAFCLFLFSEPLSIYIFIKLLYSSYWWLAMAYTVWILYDIDISRRGGRPYEWVRNWSWWRLYSEYFPIKLIKTADLDPSRNYLLACFPHGVLASGIVGSIATNSKIFSNTFTGMTSSCISLRYHFYVPFYRELLLAMGMCDASQESLLYQLDLKRYQGRAVGLVVGGAAEALHSHPGTYEITLKNRKGFVRMAMKSGAPLVPVFSFGEIDIFRPLKNPEGSLLRKFQEIMRKYIGISPVLPIGRGLLLPFRTPVHVVVGSPMEVKKNWDPADEEVNAVHAEFSKRLVELFETEKIKYLKDYKHSHLVIG